MKLKELLGVQAISAPRLRDNLVAASENREAVYVVSAEED
jgi:hypothetical protein